MVLGKRRRQGDVVGHGRCAGSERTQSAERAVLHPLQAAVDEALDRLCQVVLPWPSAGRGGLGGSSGQATTRRRRRRPGVRWRCGSCALIRLAATALFLL